MDLACGSGTLLAAMLTEMKRRAGEQGATENEIGRLQKTAVEDTLKGMDINPISLQLAASPAHHWQPGHRLPPHGAAPDALRPRRQRPNKGVCGNAGTAGPEGHRFQRTANSGLADDRIASEEVWTQGGEAMEDAVDAVRNGSVRIVIMNPPFTNQLGARWERSSPQETQQGIAEARG